LLLLLIGIYENCNKGDKMYGILMAITSIVCILLMVIVLLQSGKGEGLAGTFGGPGNMGQMFGTRRTADFLSKGTWWLAGIMAFLSILINLFFLPGASTESQRQSIIQQQGSQNIPVSPSLPQAQPPQQKAPQNNAGNPGAKSK
jgi:preprotein translocase subunit SecG